MTNDTTTYQPSSDNALRSRVKLFGTLVGDVLRDHAAEHVFTTVEALRKGYISLSKKENALNDRRLRQFIENVEGSTLEQVVRVFHAYFSLANVAEESFKHRQRRKHIHSRQTIMEGIV